MLVITYLKQTDTKIFKLFAKEFNLKHKKHFEKNINLTLMKGCVEFKIQTGFFHVDIKKNSFDVSK